MAPICRKEGSTGSILAPGRTAQRLRGTGCPPAPCAALCPAHPVSGPLLVWRRRWGPGSLGTVHPCWWGDPHGTQERGRLLPSPESVGAPSSWRTEVAWGLCHCGWGAAHSSRADPGPSKCPGRSAGSLPGGGPQPPSLAPLDPRRGGLHGTGPGACTLALPV